MIYSCTPFFNENALFEIRYNILKSLEITHVVIESVRTHAGDDKELLFEGEKPFRGNIAYAVHDNEPTGDPWDAEKSQRDTAKELLVFLDNLGDIELKDRDIILINDLDEIPTPEAIKQFNPEWGVASLIQDHYSYYLNVLQGRQTWSVPKICTWKYLKDKTLSEVRNGGSEHYIPNAGFHFSWLGGVDKVIKKMWSFAHQEAITPFTTDPENIKHKLENNLSLWTENPDDKWELVPIDDTFPRYIRDNEQKLTDLGLIKPYK